MFWIKIKSVEILKYSQQNCNLGDTITSSIMCHWEKWGSFKIHLKPLTNKSPFSFIVLKKETCPNFAILKTEFYIWWNYNLQHDLLMQVIMKTAFQLNTDHHKFDIDVFKQVYNVLTQSRWIVRTCFQLLHSLCHIRNRWWCVLLCGDPLLGQFSVDLWVLLVLQEVLSWIWVFNVIYHGDKNVQETKKHHERTSPV